MVRTLLLALLSAAILAAETPSLTLLVGNKDENSLAFVDPATGKVLGRVPTGDGPHEVVASTDGKLAFVANYGTGPAPGSASRTWATSTPTGPPPRWGTRPRRRR